MILSKTRLGFVGVLALVLVGCAPAGQKTAIGAVTGSALGAGLGAIVGSASGHAGPGIAIGAAAGAVAGGLTGNALDRADQENEARKEEMTRQQAEIDENRRLIEELRRRGADARVSNRGVVVNLPDILFEFDRARLTSEAHRTLAEISDVLRGVQERHIAVEGHTDSVGTVIYNKRLSEDRAHSVADELVANGIPRRQMSVVGYGEGSPITTNNTAEGRARNRRVEVIVEN